MHYDAVIQGEKHGESKKNERMNTGKQSERERKNNRMNEKTIIDFPKREKRKKEGAKIYEL